MLENLLAPAFLRPKVTEEDYKKLPMILQGVDAAARLSYMPTYVVDLNTQQFLYVSENPLALTGGSTMILTSAPANSTPITSPRSAWNS